MNPKTNHRVEEAAQVCGCLPEEIQKAIDHGVLPATRMGISAYQISYAALQEFYKARHGKELFAELHSGVHAKSVHDFFEVVSGMGGDEEGLDHFRDGFFHSGSR
jgi:excisionase family DNA binding protein